MVDQVTVLVERCTMQINIEPFFGGAPLPKVRKLFKYLFQEPSRNEETINTLLADFPQRINKAKATRQQAQVNYAKGYVCTQGLDLKTREKQALERQNKQLLKATETAKRQYERWVKVYHLYLDILSKNTECTE